jgi:hypothetical protein
VRVKVFFPRTMKGRRNDDVFPLGQEVDPIPQHRRPQLFIRRRVIQVQAATAGLDGNCFRERAVFLL